MKLTSVLFKQHLGRMTKYNWFFHAKKKLGRTRSEDILSKRGITVVDPEVMLHERTKNGFPEININEIVQSLVPLRPPKLDETHPDWKEIPCLKHETNDLLALGLEQAQVLTKTLHVKNGLPEKIENSFEDATDEFNKKMERIVSTASIFDACQVRLPKKKDPAKPAWSFPRDYGSTDVRKSNNLAMNMISVCEMIAGPTICQQRQLLENSTINVLVEKENKLLKFEMNVDLLLTSKKRLTPIENMENVRDLAIPDLYPMNCFINLPKSHFYKIEDLYPISSKSSYTNPHTIFIYHNAEQVKNITERPIVDHQFEARSLIKSFVTAAGCAKQKYGSEVKDLAEPVAIQCIQSDGQSYLFSVFQLNTLDIDGNEGKHNFWWSTSKINLYEKATYESGIPVLQGYNPEVFKRFLAFYKNV